MSRLMQHQSVPLPNGTTPMSSASETQAQHPQLSTPTRAHHPAPSSGTAHPNSVTATASAVQSNAASSDQDATLPSPSTSGTGKRGAPDSPHTDTAQPQKQRRISRSCDQCRNHTCTGFKPCFRCTQKGLTCTYDKPYVRGIARTPPPPPEGDNGEARNYAQPHKESGRVHRDESWVSRSCDHCRIHKLPCAGKLPCSACFKERLECTFKRRAHQRSSSNAPDGQPEHPTHRELEENARLREENLPPSSVGEPQTPDDDGPSEEWSLQAIANVASGRAPPEIEPLQFPTRYSDEQTPPLVFLHRAWRKIAIAQTPTTTPPAPDQLFLATGDLSFNLSNPTQFPMEQEMWHMMQDRFAGGWTETFHFIHRLTARAWLDTVYRNWHARAPLESGISHAKATIALMTMALGTMFNYTRGRAGKKELAWSWLWTVNNGDQMFLVTLRLTDNEPGPPTLESVQARLLQVLYLLSTCRISQAWYVFGNAVNMLTALGLHRRRGRNRGLGPEIVFNPEYAKIQCERRTFWSAYVLDRQLAMMSGRPAYLNLDAINQALPDCVNDEDMGRAGPFRPHKGDCYMEALIEQAKLYKLIEKILRQVYTLDDDTSEDERLECALRLGKSLEDWKAQLPFLMSKVRPSLFQLTWRRQHHMLQMAHWHAQILAYRPFMTAPYPAEREKQQTADFAIFTCIDAARAALKMALNLAREQAERDKSHFHTLLYVHHLTYVAASVVFLIPHVRERQKLLNANVQNSKIHRDKTVARLFELAQQAIKALVQGTNHHSPARKWGVILEELRDEAARQVPVDKNQDTEQESEAAEIARESPDEQLLEDALRAHWEADIAEESFADADENGVTRADSAPAITRRLWDEWKTTDWLDLDSAAFGPISAFNRGELPIATTKP